MEKTETNCISSSANFFLACNEMNFLSKEFKNFKRLEFSLTNQVFFNTGSIKYYSFLLDYLWTGLIINAYLHIVLIAHDSYGIHNYVISQEFYSNKNVIYKQALHILCNYIRR